MKKTAILLVAALLLVLTACNRAPSPAPNGDPTTTTTAPIVGQNDGVTYKNDYFGLAFSPADGWDLYDADEIADRNLPILSVEEGESYTDAIANAQEFYDMYAVDEESGNHIAVRVENMATMYEFLPSVTDYRTMQTSMFEGVPDLTYEFVNVTVDGQPLAALKVLWGDGEYMQTDIYAYLVKDNYMLTIELSSTDGDHSADWLSRFELL